MRKHLLDGHWERLQLLPYSGLTDHPCCQEMGAEDDKVFISLTLLGGLDWAQSDRGTVIDTVADPSGAIVGSVPINLRSTETSVSYSVANSATGNYMIAQVPGVYRMEVVAPGFKRYNKESHRVQVGQTGRMEVTLEVGSNTESITITDEAGSSRRKTVRYCTPSPCSRMTCRC